VVTFLDRPSLAVRERAATDQAPRPRMWRAKLNIRGQLLLLATSKCPPGSSTIPSPRDPFGSDHACAMSAHPLTARSIEATTFN
jgi:hypothetical protein